MDEILFEQRQSVGLITLNRPAALNALNHAMVIAMHAQLDEWASNDGIHCVVIQGAGDRAFCAGGDVRRIHDLGRAKDPQTADFFRDEYRLNTAIKKYPKPYIALLNGIVMGGGCGLSLHGSHRVVGEKIMLAMPETGIGLFPDVGGSFFLSRCPGEAGLYLGLTGARIGQADVLDLGLGTHSANAADFPDIITDLANGKSPDAILSQPAAKSGSILPQLATINELFAGGDMNEIMNRLTASSEALAVDCAKQLAKKSPTALKLTLAQVRAGRALSFDDCMRLEYRLINRVLAGHDFYEGVRAVLVDKDQAPIWQPGTLDAVDDAVISTYFEPLEHELTL
jgi:enoyl-CoA hydratase